MGSFNHYKRKVENSDLTIWRRLASLISCILRLAWKKKENFSTVLKYYEDKYHFNCHRDNNNVPPSEEVLLAILDEIVKERNEILGRG